MNASIDVRGLTQLRRNLLGFRRNVLSRDIQTRLAAVAKIAIQKNIRIGKKNVNNNLPWQQWTQVTRNARVEKGNANKGILFDSGRLLLSIKTQTQFNAASSSLSISASSNVPYASFHENGTPRMPARPFLGLTRAGRDNITQTVNNHVNALVRGLNRA